MAPLPVNVFPTPDVLAPRTKSVAMQYELTAAIEELGTTVGIADSNIWALSKPDGSIDKAAMDAHLDAMQALGVNTVRVIIPWRGNEPWGPPGTMPPQMEDDYWERSDYVIQAAAERGMGVLGVLNHAPTWGDVNPNTPIVIPGVEEAPNPQLFAAYVRRVVERYGPLVSAYEVWNEPNALSSWAPSIDPAAYTEVLKAAYDAIKGPNGPDENDPMVVAGVLGAVVSFANLTLDPRNFVEQMYANGAKGYFDALSFHPYNYSLKFSQGKWNWLEPWKANSPLQQVIEIRQTMLAYLDKEIKIWATEYGLPTVGVGAVTEEKQRAYIEDFLKSWAKLADADGTSYAGPSFLYTLRDSLINGELTEATSLGLFKYDAVTGQWVMKEAAEWLQDFLKGVNPTDPTQQPARPQTLAQVIQALVQSVQAVFRSFTDSFNAVMATFRNFIAALFPPARTAVTTVLAASEVSVQDESTATADSAGGSTAAKESAAENSAPEEAAVDDAAEEDQAEEATEEATEEDQAEEDQATEATEDATNESVAEPTEKATATKSDKGSLVRDSFVAKPGVIGDASSDKSKDDKPVTADDEQTTDSPSDSPSAGSTASDAATSDASGTGASDSSTSNSSKSDAA